MSVKAKRPAIDGDTHERIRAIFSAETSYVAQSLRRLGVHEADLDDLAQEVFVTLCERFADFDNTRRARPWLFGICLRVASGYRQLARHRREIKVDDDIVKAVDRAASPERQSETRQMQGLLYQALAELSEEQQAVFVLHELDQFSIPEIATQLGISANTAYSRLRLARDRIAAELRSRTDDKFRSLVPIDLALLIASERGALPKPPSLAAYLSVLRQAGRWLLPLAVGGGVGAVLHAKLAPTTTQPIALAVAPRAATGTPATPSPPLPQGLPVPLPARSTAPAPRLREVERDGDLTEERALLEMARTQLGRGEFAASLQALSSHARRFPTGRLVQERESLAVPALVGAKRYEEAKTRAARFERSYPSSVLLDAVRAALDEIPR